MEKFVIKNLAELREFAVTVASIVQDRNTATEATVITLSGDLGAGKTTFMQHLGQVLGVTEIMPSPTYVIFKSYPLPSGRFTELIHMDAYRIEQLAELEPLQFAQLLQNPQLLICIEWPERIFEALPKECLKLTFTESAAQEREVTMSNPW